MYWWWNYMNQNVSRSCIFTEMKYICKLYIMYRTYAEKKVTTDDQLKEATTTMFGHFIGWSLSIPLPVSLLTCDDEDTVTESCELCHCAMTYKLSCSGRDKLEDLWWWRTGAWLLYIQKSTMDPYAKRCHVSCRWPCVLLSMNFEAVTVLSQSFV